MCQASPLRCYTITTKYHILGCWQQGIPTLLQQPGLYSSEYEETKPGCILFQKCYGEAGWWRGGRKWVHYTAEGGG